MILNPERDALIRDLIIHLHDFARYNGDKEARELADCVAYMHKLWKAEARCERINTGGSTHVEYH